MISPGDATPADHRLAIRAVRAAAEPLLGLRARLTTEPADPCALATEADRLAHEVISSMLAEVVPDDGVLSEEGADDPSRLDRDRVWIIDPLDGTREFTEPPRSDWAVQVALVIEGRPVAGAIALPAEDVTLAAHPAPPAPPAHDGPPRLIVSRTRPPAVAPELAEALGGGLIEMGSAGAKAAAVVRGQAEVYAHAGGQYEWDSAAPAAVAGAAGLHVSRLDGTPIVYNKPDPWLPDLLICRPELAERVAALIRGQST